MTLIVRSGNVLVRIRVAYVFGSFMMLMVRGVGPQENHKAIFKPGRHGLSRRMQRGGERRLAGLCLRPDNTNFATFGHSINYLRMIK